MSDPSVISLLPVFITLCVSLSFGNVLLGLFSGVFIGAMILHSVSPLLFLPMVIQDYLVPEIADSYNASILILLCFIGGFVFWAVLSGWYFLFDAPLIFDVIINCLNPKKFLITQYPVSFHFVLKLHFLLGHRTSFGLIHAFLLHHY